MAGTDGEVALTFCRVGFLGEAARMLGEFRTDGEGAVALAWIPCGVRRTRSVPVFSAASSSLSRFLTESLLARSPSDSRLGVLGVLGVDVL